jgi:hypothetical protein
MSNEKYGIEDMKYIIMCYEGWTVEEYEREQERWLESTTPEEREEIRKAAIKFFKAFRKSNPLHLI